MVGEREPRLITECNHSVCAVCLPILINSCAKCPRCLQTSLGGQHMGCFPLNTSMLPTPKAELSSMDFSSILQSQDETDQCQRHRHQAQAFCFSCLQMLCIDCLFEEHKKHRVLPLKEASSRLIDKL